MADIRSTQDVSIFDEDNGYKAKVDSYGNQKIALVGKTSGNIAEVDTNNRLLVSTLPVPPTASTAVTQTAYSSMSTTVDTDYTIPNGQSLTILFFTGGSQADTNGTAVELYYDPNGNGTGMTLLDVILTSGNTYQTQLSEVFTGNGTRRIKMRRRRLSGGSIEVYGRWSGFLV